MDELGVSGHLEYAEIDFISLRSALQSEPSILETASREKLFATMKRWLVHQKWPFERVNE